MTWLRQCFLASACGLKARQHGRDGEPSASKLMPCLAYILGLGLLLRIPSQVDSVNLATRSFSSQHSSILSLALLYGLIALSVLTCRIVLALLSNSTAVLLDQLEPVATLFPCLAILDVDRQHFFSTVTLRLWVFLPLT
jgi:hypothetical protein